MKSLKVKLKDGFIYKWSKNGFVYYVGCSSRTAPKEGLDMAGLLEEVEKWHKKQGIDEGFKDNIAKFAKSKKNGGDYTYSFFRRQIQFDYKEFAKDMHPENITEPKDMTRQELLELETYWIKKYKEQGQCVWNDVSDTVEAWKRNNEE